MVLEKAEMVLEKAEMVLQMVEKAPGRQQIPHPV
jgi:hypothetical protein